MLRIKHPGAPRKKRSPARQKADERAFRIFRLRGLWSQCYLLSPGLRKVAQATVDLELSLLGAEPEGKRQARRAALLEAEFAAREHLGLDGPEFEEIPF